MNLDLQNSLDYQIIKEGGALGGCFDLNYIPPKLHAEVLTASPSEHDCIWK